MRLIDADKINTREEIAGNSEFANDIRDAIQDLIDHQPTAYDMEKVKEQLNTEAMYEDVPVYEGDKESDCYIRVSKAIEIVEKSKL